MPPRKPKSTVARQIDESPVVFFLKVSEKVKNNILPAGEITNYSEILNVVEKNSERFNTDILKQVLSSVVCDKYSPQIVCFWCCHTFSGHHFVSPISYDAYKNVYTCEGNYCSPECALANLYSEQTMSDGTRWNRHALMNHMYSSLYEEYITPAPPRTLLRMFGGPLNIEQYRNYVLTTGDVIHSSLPPIRMFFPSMNIQGPLRDIKKYVSLSNDVVEKASESLRLKRSKPVHVNIPTLDMCIQSKH